MTWVYLGIVVWAAVIISLLSYRFVQWAHRNTTEADLYYDRLDQELDDELAARRAIRPTGNCDVIPFPDIPRHRGGRGPWSLHLHDDESLRESYVDRDLGNWTDGPAA